MMYMHLEKHRRNKRMDFSSPYRIIKSFISVIEGNLRVDGLCGCLLMCINASEEITVWIWIGSSLQPYQ